MGEHDRTDERQMVEVARLKGENAQLRADAIVVAAGIDALQTSAGNPSDDFEGCIE